MRGTIRCRARALHECVVRHPTLECLRNSGSALHPAVDQRLDKIVEQNAGSSDYFPAGSDSALIERNPSRAARNLDMTVPIGTSSKVAISA